MAAAGPTTSGPWRRLAPVLAPSALMVALGLWGIGRGSMYSGEAATHWAAHLPLGRLAHLLSHFDAVHGLYYLLMHAWAVFGTNDGAQRIPSVLGLTGAVVLTALTGSRLSGSPAVGLLAGLIMALNPTMSEYAQDARSYALVMCAVAASGLALVRALEPEPDRSTALRWSGYAALIVLSGYLNELALLVLLAHGVSVVAARATRRQRVSWLLSAVIAALVVLPLVIVSTHETAAVSWIRPPDSSALPLLVHDYFATSTAVAALLVGCAALALIPGPALWRALGQPGRRDAWAGRAGLGPVSFALPLLVIPPATLLVESLVGKPLFADRYVLFCAPGAALLAAAGLDRAGRYLAAHRLPRARFAPAVACLLVVVLSQVSIQQWLRTPQSRPQNYAAAADFVRDSARRGDAVVFVGDNYRNIKLGYPQEFRGLADPALARSPEQSGTFRGVLRPELAIGRSMVGHDRVWLVGLPPSTVVHGVSRRILLVLHRHFRRIETRRFHGIEVTLYSRHLADSQV